MSAIPGLMKLYRYRCGCIAGTRYDDGTAFVITDCDGRLVFDKRGVNAEARKTTFKEVTKVMLMVRQAIRDANKLRDLRKALHVAMEEV